VVRKGGRKGNSDATAIPIDVIVLHYAGEVKYGRNISVRCCMHDDTRRSAVINTDKNLYYCHTCGKGGSAVDVVMVKEEMSFKDALEYANEIVTRGGGTLQSGNKRRGARLSRRTWNI
jgi:DNA primase